MKSLKRNIYARSFLLLRDRISAYFGKDLHCCVDYLNKIYPVELYLKKRKGTALNVVLSGNVQARFLEVSTWPVGKYRLWVLSHAARNLLHYTSGLPKKKIGVVPRYKLFAVSRKPRALNINKPFTFIYGGRLDPIKGVLQMVELTQILQTKYSLPVRLVLSGDFAQAKPIDRPSSGGQLKIEVRKLIKSLVWVEPPQFIHGLSPMEWTKGRWKNPVFISLSQFIHEDFGVSLAQAQSLGWPCVLSSWHGHRDAQLANTWLAPKFSIHAPAAQRRQEMEYLAEQFVRHFSKKSKAHLPKSAIPQTIHQTQLTAYAKKIERRYPGATKASEKGFKGFLRKPAGKKMFRDYHAIC